MERVFAVREKIIFYFAIAVIILSIGFNFLAYPLLNKNRELNREISLTKIKLKKYLRLLSRKEEMQGRYSKLTSSFKVSGEKKDTSISVLSELEHLAKEANIRIIDIRPQSGFKSVAIYKEILIELKTEGAMEGYLNFVYNLENSLSLLRIKRLQFSAKPNTQVLEGSFTISQLLVTE